MTWSGRLLVATPSLEHPEFARTVILLLQHDDEEGALGLIVNRPLATEVVEVLPKWADLAGEPSVVFGGGPVQPTGAICIGRRRPGAPLVGGFSELEGSPVLGTIDLDSPVDELARVVESVRVFAGYAGWTAGQLEAEVEDGSWWVLDALPGDAFSPSPGALWSQVLRRQGPPLAFAANHPGDPTLN